MAAVPRSAFIVPDWPAPATVGAMMSTRQGGVSQGPCESLNLGLLEEPELLLENQRRYRQALGAEPVFLRQVHGTRVVRLQGAVPMGQLCADACLTTERGLACTVLVADCLPVLLCDSEGQAVAAAHAGWRGLAAGVLDRTVQALCEASGVPPQDLRAWLGPCIGPDAFEVGSDVVQAFGVAVEPGSGQQAPVHAGRFRDSPHRDGTPRWRADLAGLAADQLVGLGVRAITRHGGCTVSDRSRFFSFRRDGHTGRMAASIWRR